MGNFRVFIAIETFLPLIGGSERQAFLQSKYLRSLGIKTTIITMHFLRDSPVSEYLEGVPVLRIAGCVLARRDRLPGVLRRFCYLIALLVLAWQLWTRRRDYEVLHVFQLTFFTLPVLLVCRLAHKPLIVGMRCDLPYLAKGRAGQSARLWTGLERLALLDRMVLGLSKLLLQNTGARIIVLSTHMRESLSKYGFTVDMMRLIPNGVDTLFFRPCMEQREEDGVVICVAKLRYQKGIDLLLRAWCSVVEQVPEARLLIAGDGPLLASLQDLAGVLEITSSVEFTGLCTDVAAYFRRGRIAVLPSRWEGMPNALLEAMSSGLACVATRVSGSEDLIGQGERGLLVEPGDREGLARAILLFLKKPELARRYGQAARQHVEQHYTFSSVMNRHLDLYQAVLEKHQKGLKYRGDQKARDL